MNDTRLAELKEIYKGRNLMEELAWGTYANHSGYTSKQNGEFLNWLCLMAYKALKEVDNRKFDNAINKAHDDGFEHGYLQAKSDYKVVLEQIKAEINLPNRGTCDYFIVDRIEEIIDKYISGGKKNG